MRVRSQRQQDLDPPLDEADSDLYARAQELHAAWMQASSDVGNFRAAMQSQRIIGQAVGLLMAKLNVDADRAFALLAEESQSQNIKVREIAKEHIARHAR